MSRSDFDYSFELGGKMNNSFSSYNQSVSPTGFPGGRLGGSPKQESLQSHNSNSSSPGTSSYGSVGELGSSPKLTGLKVEVPSQRHDIPQGPPSYSSSV